MLSAAVIRIKDEKLEQTFASKPQKHRRTGNKASKLRHLGGDWEIILGRESPGLRGVADLLQNVFLSVEAGRVRPTSETNLRSQIPAGH